MEEQNRLLADFKYWLNREGIALPPERYLEALADFADIRRHVEIVNGEFGSETEPATVFALRPGMPHA